MSLPQQDVPHPAQPVAPSRSSRQLSKVRPIVPAQVQTGPAPEAGPPWLGERWQTEESVHSHEEGATQAAQTEAQKPVLHQATEVSV